MSILRSRQSSADSAKNAKSQINIIVIAAVLLVIIGFLTFQSVPAGQKGVVLRFGAVTGRIMNEGLNTKLPFADSVVKMSVQTQMYEAQGLAASKDLQDVKATVALNYRLDPAKVAEIYQTLGMDYVDRIAKPQVQEVVKAISARYNAEDMITKRENVKDDITSSLKDRLSERGIIVEAVSITNFEFSSEFTKAIEAKVVATQQALQAENKLRQIEVEARQVEAAAKGQANAAIAKAEGDAQAIKIVAQAQTEANKLLQESLSEPVLRYQLIQELEHAKVVVVPSDINLLLSDTLVK